MAYGGFINERRRGTREESVSKHQIQPRMEMSRLTRDGTAEPVSRDQILRHARGQGNVHFPCSADHEQDWQPYPVDPYSAICDDHTYIRTYFGSLVSSMRATNPANVSVQFNGGILPDIILLTRCGYIGEPF